MRALATLVLLVTATGGCATEPADPADDSVDPAIEDPWPCGSRTLHADGKETVETYAWDANHNLVRKTDDSGAVFTARFDPTGTIAIEEIHESPRTSGIGTNRETLRRVVEGGRILREERTFESGNVNTTTFRYEAGRLVEKHTVGGTRLDVLTTVWYQDPDIRVEDDEVRAGPLSNGSRVYKGEPWYEAHDLHGVERIVTRDLDEQGRELRVKRWTRGDLEYDEVVDIERAPNGAPVREVWVRKDGQDRTVTYQTACSP